MKLPKSVPSIGRLLVVSRLLALIVLTQLALNVMYGAALLFEEQMASYTGFPSQEHQGTVKIRYHLHSECSRYNVRIRGHRVFASKPRSNDWQYEEMVLESESFSGPIRVRGQKSGLYMCFNKRGRLIVRSDGKSAKCHFFQKMSPDGFLELQSQVKPEWFVGFKKNGKPLKGYDAYNPRRARKCFQFTASPFNKKHHGSRWAPSVNSNYLWHLLKGQRTASGHRTNNGHRRHINGRRTLST